MDNNIDIHELRYVLYARKSTTDESRQIRSIGDQIKDCKERVITPLGLNVVDIFQETKSAKTPHIRPIFDQILKDIRKGKYDGIVAWNPDRLARNMLEGGEIIDMIDNGVIKDLKFVTHHFTGDANGKMLLGMAFVLSKQYSDDLSQKVTRGVHRNFDEGKSGIPKHGYIRNENGMYETDGKNFELICDAWKMRKEGYTYADIITYLVENGYYRKTQKGRKIRPNKDTLRRIFNNPFYYGMLYSEANDKYTDLREAYNFTPAVSEEDYYYIQKMTSKKPSIKEGKAFYPFRKFILCSFCNHIMYIAPSKGSKQYLYARCDTKGCSRNKKSIRIKVILSFLYKFLDKGLNFTENEYHQYASKMVNISEKKKQELKNKRFNKQGLLNQLTADVQERSLKIIKIDESSPIYKANEKQILKLQSQIEALENDIKNLNNELGQPNDSKISITEFLNYSKEASAKLKAGNPIAKDQIVRNIFLNLTVNEEKVVSYQLKEPFATLLKMQFSASGRGGET